MRIVTLLLFLAGLSIPLQGQQEKVSVRTLAITPGEFPTVWGLDSTTAVKLEFPTVQPSEAYQLSRDANFPIYQGELDEKGKPRDTSPSLLKLPEGDDLLLLAWMQEGKLKLLPVRDAPASGKANDWLVVNMTHKSVGIQVGENKQPVAFPAVSCKPFHIDRPAGEATAIVMAGNDNGTWNKFFSTYWPVPADKRCLILLVQIGENIEVRQIFEDLNRKATKAAEPKP